MIFQAFFLVACVAGVIHGNYLMSYEEMAAVQERLAKYEMLEDTLKSVFVPEEKGEEKREGCIPIGGECKVFSGPNCCGIELNCIVDEQGDPIRKGGPPVWRAHCRENNGGLMLKKFGEFFEDVGKKISG